MQARVCRSRPKSTGESDALAVSEAIPFLEYELFRQLMLKLKVIGRNAGGFSASDCGRCSVLLSTIATKSCAGFPIFYSSAFALKSEVDVGQRLIVSTVTVYHISK